MTTRANGVSSIVCCWGATADIAALSPALGQGELAILSDTISGSTIQLQTNYLGTLYTIGGGFSNPMTTAGDIIIENATPAPARLGIGSTGQVLTVVSGLPAWAATATVSPLTTKGDVYGFSSANARIPVGSNGQVLMGDSTQTLGVGYSTQPLDCNTQQIINVVDPTTAQMAATKNYVDTAVQALAPKNDCVYSTSAALAAYTYNNVATPPSGVGATITLTTAAVLVIGGGTPTVGQRVLINKETGANAPYNGPYTLTTPGVLGVTQAVLTRTTDFDQPGDGINGALIAIIAGTNAGTLWYCTAAGSITFGTTNLTFSPFTGTTYSADGTTLALTGTTFSIYSGYVGQSSIVTVGTLTGGATGAGFTIALSTSTVTGTLALARLPAIYGGYLNGIGLNYVSTSVLGIAAGGCIDSTNAVLLTATTFTKSTAGSWTAGSGNDGMGTGLTIATSTMYYVYAILKSGSYDVYFDTSASAANAPAGITAYRLIGTFQTDSSANILPFVQWGRGNDRWYQFGEVLILSAGTATGWTQVNCSSVVPSTAVAIFATLLASSSASDLLAFFGPYISSVIGGTSGVYAVTSLYGIAGAQIGNQCIWMCCISQSLMYFCQTANLSAYVYVGGYQESL